jgi:PAS domain-containing protein
MAEDGLFRALLESQREPFVFADPDHVIRYMNESAIAYYARWGGAELLGRSLLACHNEQSCKTIREVSAAMARGGVEDVMITDEGDGGRRIFMRAVRGADGRYLGYHERFEPTAWTKKTPPR